MTSCVDDWLYSMKQQLEREHTTTIYDMVISSFLPSTEMTQSLFGRRDGNSGMYHIGKGSWGSIRYHCFCFWQACLLGRFSVFTVEWMDGQSPLLLVSLFSGFLCTFVGCGRYDGYRFRPTYFSPSLFVQTAPVLLSNSCMPLGPI